MSVTDRKLLERIWKAVAAIPHGEVASYGGIARRAGLPRRARLVGHALKVAPANLKLPWHRVLNARGFERAGDGRIAGGWPIRHGDAGPSRFASCAGTIRPSFCNSASHAQPPFR